MPRTLGALAALTATLALAIGTLASPALADGGRKLFITSAVEDGHGHATLPLHTGTSQIPGIGKVSASFIIPDALNVVKTSRQSFCTSGSLASVATRASTRSRVT